jgi:hypothetical protein
LTGNKLNRVCYLVDDTLQQDFFCTFRTVLTNRSLKRDRPNQTFILCHENLSLGEIGSIQFAPHRQASHHWRNLVASLCHNEVFQRNNGRNAYGLLELSDANHFTKHRLEIIYGCITTFPLTRPGRMIGSDDKIRRYLHR